MLLLAASIMVMDGLSAKSVSHSAVFFSHNKLANNTFSHALSAKQTGRR
jgi:hypothetical protein